MNNTIVIKDQRYLNHLTGEYHPESHHRLEWIYRMLHDDDMAGRFREIQPRAATHEEIALNHTPAYIERIAQTAGKPHIMLDPDTAASAGSWEAARYAVGGVLTALDMLMQGNADNGFALIRPPGHHAETARAMGFCLFNNVAIGARYLMKQYKLERILIVDWDLHHGNGTQNAFYNSSEVLYFSTHQYPYYPGSGSVDETGEGNGLGYTVNVPLHGGQGDEEYKKIFYELLLPIAAEYKPQFILISAGYDPYFKDPLGAMQVTPFGFASMTSLLMTCAEKFCGGKLLIALEGGYHLEGITESAKKTLATLIDNKAADADQKTSAPSVSFDTENVLRSVKRAHSKYWSSLR
jgi:acetoin utilization deacetylase AcuC-like enzyme